MAVNNIDARLVRVLTQYRESPALLGIIRTYCEEAQVAQDALCAIPEFFDLNTAVGDQLTIIGRWLGFPRCHQVPSPVPVFGFKCDGIQSRFNLVGFCEGGTWSDCPGLADVEVCINDDDLYRRFLQVRRYQLLGMNDYMSFQESIEILFGDQATFSQLDRQITVDIGRQLDVIEEPFIQVFQRVLPRAVSANIILQES